MEHIRPGSIPKVRDGGDIQKFLCACFSSYGRGSTFSFKRKGLSILLEPDRHLKLINIIKIIPGVSPRSLLCGEDPGRTGGKHKMHKASCPQVFVGRCVRHWARALREIIYLQQPVLRSQHPLPHRIAVFPNES
jgi:hypothetical protein